MNLSVNCSKFASIIESTEKELNSKPLQSTYNVFFAASGLDAIYRPYDLFSVNTYVTLTLEKSYSQNVSSFFLTIIAAVRRVKFLSQIGNAFKAISLSSNDDSQ